MLYTIIIALLVLGLIFGMFQWVGWVVGVFNRKMNEKQRFQAGVLVSMFFLSSIILKGCEWSNGGDRLEKQRGQAFRDNNPGYYDSNSPNFGQERPESYRLIQAKQAINDYDDKMAKSILLWVGGYILLVVIGYIGESVFPLRE
jgi:hypothetical protein